MNSQTSALLNQCESMRSLSQRLRESSDGNSNDIPDVFDTSASIISSVLGDRADDKLLDNTNADIKKLVELMSIKEKNFVKKVEQRISQVSQSVDQKYIKLQSVQEKYHQLLDKISEVHQGIVKQEEMRNDLALKEQQKLWDDEKEQLKNEEKSVHSNIERVVSEKLSQISGEYSSKLEKYEIDIKNAQKALQEMVHEKHQQGKIKSDLLASEERRMASEHERISIEYQQRKRELQIHADELRIKVNDIKEEILNQSIATKEKLKKLEEDILADRERILKQRQDELKALQLKVDVLNNEISQKSSELEHIKLQKDNEINQIKDQYKQKFSNIRNQTEREIKNIKDMIHQKYEPKLKEINLKIKEEELKRGTTLDNLRKSSIALLEKSEKEIEELTNNHNQELSKLDNQIDELNTKLKVTLAQKESDLTDLKHANQLTYGQAMQEYDYQEYEYNKKINALMKQFDDENMRLVEGQQISIKRKNKKNAQKLGQIIQKHEERKKQILEDLERQMQDELEREINEKLELERRRHTSNLEDLKMRVQVLQGKNKNLTSKIDKIIEENKTKDLASTSKTEPFWANMLTQSSNEDQLKELQDQPNKELEFKGLSLVNKIISESKEVERRRELIIKETLSLDEQIKNAVLQYENNIIKMQNSYQSQKAALESKKSVISESLYVQEGKNKNQENMLSELSEKEHEREKEIEKMEEKFEQLKEEFHEKTKKEYEASLEAAKQPVRDVEAEIEKCKTEFAEETEKLNKQLKDATAATEKVTAFLLKQREVSLLEAEMQLRFEHEEKIKILTSEHNQRIQTMNDEFEMHKRKSEETVESMEKEKIEKFAEHNRNFTQRETELNTQYDNLNAEGEELDRQIDEISNRECPECAKKKKVLRDLLAKRELMQKRIDNLIATHRDMEHKLNSIFNKVEKVTSGRVIPIVPRAHTATGKRPRLR